MKNVKFLILASAFSAFALTGCFENESDASTQTNNSNGSALQASSPSSSNTDTAQEPSMDSDTRLSGIYCQESEHQKSGLVTMHINNMDTLMFNLQTWNKSNGHGCGITNAVADKSGENEWTYNFRDGDVNCMINITAREGGFDVQETPGSCKAFCGVHVTIGDINFPSSSKTSAKVSKDDLNGEPCS